MFDARTVKQRRGARRLCRGVRRIKRKFPKQNGRRPVQAPEYLKARMQSRDFYDLESLATGPILAASWIFIAGTFSAI